MEESRLIALWRFWTVTSRKDSGSDGMDMKISEVKQILKAKVTSGEDRLDMIVQAGAGSDLMSDLLRGSKEGVLVLSGLNNIQAIRTCVIAGVAALVLVRGKEPDEEMKAQAREHGLPVLTTPFTMFTACGRLFKAGLRGVDPKKTD
jgi:predicted transcriptional regulator